LANTDWAFGFLPYGEVLRANYYCVKTAPAIGYYHGDVVGLEGVAILTPHLGYLPAVFDDGVVDGLDNLIGAVLGVFDENFSPVKYIAKAEIGNGTIAGYLLIADDPNQLFVVREDFDGAAIDLVDASTNVDIQSVTDNLGNNQTGKSTQMLDSSTQGSAAARNVKIYGPHPLDASLVGDDTPGTTLVEGCRYIVQITEHYYGSPSVDGGKSA